MSISFLWQKLKKYLPVLSLLLISTLLSISATTIASDQSHLFTTFPPFISSTPTLKLAGNESIDASMLAPISSEDEATIPTQASPIPPIATTTQLPSKSPITVPITLPEPIGTIVLEGTIDIATQAFSMSASFAKKPKIDIGILSLSNPKATFSNTKGFQFKADFSIFNNIKGKLGLEEVKLGQYIIFSLTLDKPIILPLSPWRPIELDSLYLYLSKTEQKLYSSFSIFKEAKTKEFTVSFGLEKKNPFAKLDIQSIALKDVIGILPPEFGKITLTQATFTITNALNSKGHRTVSATSTTNLQSLNKALPAGLKVNLKNLQTSLIIDSINGFELSAKLESELPLIPSLCILKNPEFKIVKQIVHKITPQTNVTTDQVTALPSINTNTETIVSQNSSSQAITAPIPPVSGVPILTLRGQVNVTLPELGTINTDLISMLQLGKFGSFEGNITTNISFFNTFSLQNARFLVYAAKGGFKAQISTKANITLGPVTFDANANLTLDQDPKTKQYGLTFFGDIADEKPLQPFKGTKIKEIESLTLSKIGIGFDTRTKSFFLQGQMQVLNLPPLYGKLLTTQKIISFTANIAKEWHLSDTIPKAKGTMLDDIDFSQNKIVVSSGLYRDSTLDVEIKQGINLITKAPISGPVFDGLRTILAGACPSSLMIAGSIGTNLQDVSLRAFLPISLALGPQIKVSNIFFEIDGDGPALALVGQFEVKPTPKDNPLIFSGKLLINPDKASVSASMQGMWNQPLGIPIPGFAIGDLGLEVGIDYAVFAATYCPTVFGITGTLNIGRAKMQTALKVTANLLDIIIYGYLNQLSLADMIDFGRDIGIPLPPNIDLPNMKIENVELRVAPTGGKIGEISFAAGLTLRGRVELLNAFAMADFNISTDGIRAQWAFSELQLGPLLVTGRGLEGSSQLGPVASLILTLDKQQYRVSGLTQLFDSLCRIDIDVSSKGFKLYGQTKIANQFNAKITGQSVGSGKNLDIQLSALLEDDFIFGLCNDVEKTFNDIKTKTNQDITKAQNDLKKMDKDIYNLNLQIFQKQKQVKQLEAIIEQKTQLAQSKMLTRGGGTTVYAAQQQSRALKQNVQSFTLQINEALKKVQTITNDINKTTAELNFCKKNANQAWKVPSLSINLTALKTSQWVAWNVLQGLKNSAKAVQATSTAAQGALFDPSSLAESGQIAQLGLEITGLEQARNALILSKEAALGILEAAKDASGIINDVVKAVAKISVPLITKTGAGLIQVRRAYIKTSAKQMLAGKLPYLELELFVARTGRQLPKISLQFDIKNPGSFITKYTEAVVQAAKGALVG